MLISMACKANSRVGLGLPITKSYLSNAKFVDGVSYVYFPVGYQTPTHCHANLVSDRLYAGENQHQQASDARLQCGCVDTTTSHAKQGSRCFRPILTSRWEET